MKIILLILVSGICSAQGTASLQDKIYGMLIGSVIGDAAGGPLEFINPPCRSKWTTQKLTPQAIQALCDSFKMRAYTKKAEPFCPMGRLCASRYHYR